MGSRLVVGLLAGATLAVVLSGCGSAQKARQLEREKLIASTGLYCDFINGDEFQDIEVQLNLQIARKCEPNKNYTITSFKNSSDLYGVLFCCSVVKKDDPKNKHIDTKHDDFQILDEVGLKDSKDGHDIKPGNPPTTGNTPVTKNAAPPATTPPPVAKPATPPSAPPAAKSTTSPPTGGGSTSTSPASPSPSTNSAPSPSMPEAKPGSPGPASVGKPKPANIPKSPADSMFED